MNTLLKNKIQFGVYSTTNLENKKADLSLDLTIPVNHLKHWEKCSIVANFFSLYHAQSYTKNQEKYVSILSTITNEIIENAVKFSTDNSRFISVKFRKFNENIFIETHNTSNEYHTQKLNNLIKNLKSNSPKDLFLNKIIENEKYASICSEIGLLTLIKDYTENIGIKIEPKPFSEKAYNVHVCVQINETELENIINE